MRKLFVILFLTLILIFSPVVNLSTFSELRKGSSEQSKQVREQYEYTIAAGSDDAYAYKSNNSADSEGASNSASTIRFGNNTTTVDGEVYYYMYRAYLRFQLDIPKDTTISTAHLRFVATSTIDSTFDATVWLLDNDTVDPFPSHPSLYDWKVTEHNVRFYVRESWSEGGIYKSSDLAELIREFIARPGYVENNYIGLRIDANSTYESNGLESEFRFFASEENLDYSSVTLIVNTTKVRVEPEYTWTYGETGTFGIQIEIRNGDYVGGFDITVRYNPVVLSVSGIASGGYIKYPLVLADTIDREEGVIRYAEVAFLSAEGTIEYSSGNGTLFSISFAITSPIDGLLDIYLSDLARMDPANPDVATPILHIVEDGFWEAQRDIFDDQNDPHPPKELRVEGWPSGSLESMNLTEHLPLFSWQFYDSYYWEDYQTAYQVQVYNISGGGEVLWWDSGQIDGDANSIEYPSTAPELADGYDYKLLVRTRDARGPEWSTWSEMKFHLNKKPPIPSLLYPPNQELDFIGNTIKWLKVEDYENSPITYFWEVALDKSFTNLVANGSTMLTHAELTLNSSRTYYWRVKAWDGYENSSWSSIHSFTVKPFVSELSSGWNAIGITLSNSTVDNAEELAQLIGEDCNLVARWNTSTQEFDFYQPGSWVNNFKLTASEGYFVYLSNPGSITLDGVLLTQPVRLFKKGWNTLTLVEYNQIFASEYVELFEPSFTAIAKWSPSLHRYITYLPELGLSDFQLRRGEAYFVYFVPRDWEISSEVVIEDKSITLLGDLEVSFGSLTLRNVTLKVGCWYSEYYDEYRGYDITFSTRGECFVYNSTITTITPYYNYQFTVLKDASFVFVNSSLYRAGWKDSYPGLRIYANESIIKNSTFSENYNGITLSRSSRHLIERSLFYNNTNYGIYLHSADNVTISNTTIARSSEGIVLEKDFYYPIGPNDNEILYCQIGLPDRISGRGIEMDASNGRVERNKILYTIVRAGSSINMYRGCIDNEVLYSTLLGSVRIGHSSSTDNLILSNIIRGSGISAGGNQWNTSAGGNYWLKLLDDYWHAIDIDENGCWDNYNIEAGSEEEDLNPLVSPPF